MTEDPSKQDSALLAEGAGFRDAAWLAVAVVLIVVVVIGGWRLAGPPNRPLDLGEGPRQLAAFELTERSGRTVAAEELAGRFLVVNFVYTSCSVSCLQVNRRMAEIQRLSADQPDVRLVSITLDPRTDSPAVLTKFASRFGADTNRWLFLTGDKPSVYGLLEASFLRRDTNDLTNLAPGGFVGMEQISVVDPQGRVLAFFNGLHQETPADVLKLIAELRRRP